MLLLQPLDAQGNASGKALYLAAGTLSLGRDEGCQVQLHGNSISREHAQLVVSPDVQGVLAAEIRDTSKFGSSVIDEATGQEHKLKKSSFTAAGTSCVLRFGKINSFRLSALPDPPLLCLVDCGDDVHQAAARLGYSSCTAWQAGCTHVIAPDGPCLLSPTLAHALQLGVPILTPAWLAQCEEAAKGLAQPPATGSPAQLVCKPAPSKSGAAASLHVSSIPATSVLSEHKLCSAPAAQNRADWPLLQGLVEKAGGSWAPSQQEATLILATEGLSLAEDAPAPQATLDTVLAAIATGSAEHLPSAAAAAPPPAKRRRAAASQPAQSQATQPAAAKPPAAAKRGMALPKAPSAKRAKVDTEMEIAEPELAQYTGLMEPPPKGADGAAPLLEGKSIVTRAPLVVSAPAAAPASPSRHSEGVTDYKAFRKQKLAGVPPQALVAYDNQPRQTNALEGSDAFLKAEQRRRAEARQDDDLFAAKLKAKKVTAAEAAKGKAKRKPKAAQSDSD